MYLKSSLEHYGVSVPAIRSVVKTVRTLSHDDLVAVVKALWDEPVHERRMAAVELLALNVDRLGYGDAALLERLVRESRTWALVDVVAASVVGTLVERDGRFGDVLDRWAANEDLWIRRSALLALLVPLRKGLGDFERFGRYADAMLDERELFVARPSAGYSVTRAGSARTWSTSG